MANLQNYPRGQNKPQLQKVKFSTALSTPAYQNLIRNTLGDPDTAKRFIAAISSAVATTPALQECDNGSIVSGALLGESLKLSHSPQIGHYYLVPFKNKREGTSKAQFILGYKGYLQLAIRSGYYKHLNVLEIKEGELNSFDPLSEDISVTLIDDFDRRESTPTIGYFAFFEYTNGFRKAIYWSKEKMLSHASKYSKAFSRKAYEDIQAGKVSDRDMAKYSSFWYKDFDAMAKKTMLRQLISKWGIMSIELQNAFTHDYATGEVSAKGDIIFEEATDEHVSDAEYINEVVSHPEAEEVVDIPFEEDGDLFEDD